MSQVRALLFPPTKATRKVVFLLEWEKDNRAKNRNRSQIYAKRKSDEGGRTYDKASKADTRERNKVKKTANSSGTVVPTNKSHQKGGFFVGVGKRQQGEEP